MADILSSHYGAPTQAPTWLTLPHKAQLLLLFLGRLSDFYQVASLQTYIFYQLTSLSPTLSPAEISSQTGVLNGSFTAVQCITAVIWGRVADSSFVGRKPVLVIGLLATAASCIGVAFAGSFAQAVLWRVFGGAMNGTVGITRTMLSEIIAERKYQSRAFLLLPLSFNIAAFFGPILGGLLAPRLTVAMSPAPDKPTLSFGLNKRVNLPLWIPEKFPYAVPSLLSAFLLLLVAASIFLGIEETLISRKGQRDLGSDVATYLRKRIFRFADYTSHKYAPLEGINNSDGDNDDQEELSDLYPNIHSENGSQNQSYSRDQIIGTGSSMRDELLDESVLTHTELKPSGSRVWPGFRDAFIAKLLILLFVQGLYDLHIGAYTTILILYLSTPTNTDSLFTGGLALSPTTVGISLSALGLFGTILQLALYPLVHERLGTLRCYQIFNLLFPIAYALTPLLSVFVSSYQDPSSASIVSEGYLDAPLVASLLLLFLILTAARVFTLPSTIILLNNSAPAGAGVLGTVHGFGQAVSASMRTFGAIVGGMAWGVGLRGLSAEDHSGIGGLKWVWAGIVGCATLSWVASLAIKEP